MGSDSGSAGRVEEADSVALGMEEETSHDFDEDSDVPDATLTMEDNNLLYLYESRLRRKREYERAVASPFQASINRQNEERVVPEHGPPPSFRTSLVGISRCPPSVIDINIGDNSHEGDVFDDISTSTGIESKESSRFSLGRENINQTARSSDERLAQHNTELEPTIEKANEDAEGQDSFISGVEEEQSSQKSTGATNSSDKGSRRKITEDSNNGPFTYTASQDSMFASYALLVDPSRDDQAVEILLYSAARPHMRGFHFAWLGFFVAFFTWFSITPLLSQVALSLSLTRTEIWTSSVLAVSSSAITRIIIGPINDMYGARYTMSATLLFCAIPTGFAGLAIQNATSLYAIRFLIGVAGSAFVTCQSWSSSLFIPEVAGTANSLAAGWGNLGGGVAQIVIGTLIFPLLKIAYGGEGYGTSSQGFVDDDVVELTIDRASDLAWRTALIFPAVACIYMTYACLKFADDSPKGNYSERKKAGTMQVETPSSAMSRSCCNRNTWLLSIHYACCFGVELTMTNAAALYFQEEFGQTTESAAAIASVFGWMNLFARGIGGFCSDMLSASHGMRGRLWIQSFLLLTEGALVCVFSTTQSLVSAIFVMITFSIFVQAAEGSTFAIVPYIDHGVTGSVSGIIGAGGNVGGVIFSLIFRAYSDRSALLLMGFVVMASSLTTAFLSVSGHRSLLSGEDADEVVERRDSHVEHFGTRPNVELHATLTGERKYPRQATLRPESIALDATVIHESNV